MSVYYIVYLPYCVKCFEIDLLLLSFHLPLQKRIKEKLVYEDLEDKDESEGVSLRLTHMDRYLHGPTPTVTSTSFVSRHSNDDVLTEDAIMAVAHEVEGWASSRHQV